MSPTTTTLPPWATSVANPNDELCECGKLPYLAQVPIATTNAHLRRTSTSHTFVCYACLLLERSARGDGTTFKEAGDFDEALTPPWRASTYSIRDIERLFEVPYLTVKGWIRCGWLHVPPHLPARSARISYESLLLFMRNTETWIAWEAERVQDEALRAWATAIRLGWPWHWMRVDEVAQELGYSVDGVYSLLYSQALASFRHLKRWYVRSDEVRRFQREVMPTRSNGPRPQFDEPMVKASVFLPESQASVVRALGNGSFTNGIRRLLKERESGEMGRAS